MKKSHSRAARVLLGLSALLAACGGDNVAEPAASAGDEQAASSSPTPPALGEWMIKGWEKGFVEPNSVFWIDDIRLTESSGGKTKTFSGTMGCGLSNCSGHYIGGVKGTWKVHGNATAPRIDFIFDGQTQTYAYKTEKNSGGPSALVFTLQNDPVDPNPGPFTMFLVSH